MSATTVSLTRRYGFDTFHCFHCGVVVFGEEGPADRFCKHVLLYLDPMGDPELGPAASHDLSEKLDAIDADVPEELASVLDDDAIVFELVEPGRGGGHDGYVLLVAFVVDESDDED